MSRYLVVLLSFFLVNSSYSQTIVNVIDSLPYINCLLAKSDTTLLVGTNKGLFEIKGRNISTITKNNKIIKANKLIIDNHSNIWIGTYYSSLIKLNNLNEFEEFSFKKQNDNFEIVTSLYFDFNNIWIGTSEGKILKFSLASKMFSAVKSPTSQTIYSLLIDHNNYWLCSSDGIFNKSRSDVWNKMNGISLGYNLYRNNKTNWLVGRNNSNLPVLMYQNNFNNWENTSILCLNDNEIKFNDISFDTFDNSWLATEKGLIRFNPENETCLIFNRFNNKLITDVNIKNIVAQNDSMLWFSNSKNELANFKYNDIKQIVSIPTDTTKIRKCDELVKPGGSGYHEYFVDLQKNNGVFELWYDMRNIPDKLSIYCSDKLIYITKNKNGEPAKVNGSKTETLKHNCRYIKVIVEGNENGTSWRWKIKCKDK